MLRNQADRKTMCFALIITGLFFWNWHLAEFQWEPFLTLCFGAICVSSMVHNNVHVSTFSSSFLNRAYDYWLTVFYGYPVFAWISTHNQNHHVYNNRKGDFAPSYIVSEKNNLLTLLSYPTVSGWVQQNVNRRYIVRLWHTKRNKAIYCISQFLFLFVYIGVAFVLNWKKALLYVVIPQQVSLNTVLIFNYLQHIHCDEESNFNHSRNVVGRVANFFLFNNGYHTAHHLKPLLHWSDLKKMHEEISRKIDPRLNEPSFLWMLFRMYILGIFFPSCRSYNMRKARMELENRLEQTQQSNGATRQMPA